ncbi:phosphoribosyltransferase-like protein [Mycena floridula]|nr:phosphoribosyltransferase-like protein [Mycena floridula]
MSSLKSYQDQLIQDAMAVGALKFGSFTLKSGRISPYFFNASLLSSGSILSTLSTAYAATIVDSLPQFDVLFGPAYKGIPFAAITVLQLQLQHGKSIGLAYDRKEIKDHGEGGKIVGVPVAGQRVIILDDVMTSGKAVREAIATVRTHGGQVVAVVQCLDREEVGQDGVSSTVREIEEFLGQGPGTVKSILTMRNLMAWLQKNEKQSDLELMTEYWKQYGLKD